ncbi:MAG: ABC transporter substrate-binding protein [Proteobacteria bacterium]|nr:ABC transporter substrate-binding protein [Pseudomonadota bacterium]
MRAVLHSKRHRLYRSHRFRAAIAAIALTVMAGGATPASAKPQRIVSMNVCADQLVMLLADRDRIASISFLAADPYASALAGAAVEFRLNYGLSEEILPMNPDLVLASAFTTRSTLFLLRKLGYPVVELPVASSLDDIRSNIRTVAKAIGEEARGEAMIAAFDAELPRQVAPSGPRPLAALYWANGYTSGIGTLANAAVEAAGFRTLGRQLDLVGTSQLPLETLLVSNADVIIIGQRRDGAALANETFRHSALREIFARRPSIEVPDYLWVCATPFIAKAIRQLAEARKALRRSGSTGVERIW